MKKITLLLILSLGLQTAGFTQGCLPDGISFTTQAEIDNFQTNYPGCTEIEGDVTIRRKPTVHLSTFGFSPTHIA